MLAFFNKNLKNIEIVVKVAIVSIFSFFLYYQIFYKNDSAELWKAYQNQLASSNPLWLLTAFLLMPLNLFLEALKWRRLADVFEHFSIGLAYKAVFTGATIGIFTPNRIGEYGGRLLFTPKDKAVQTVIATLLGSFSQLLALIGFGIIGCFYFFYTYFPELRYFIFILLIISILGFFTILFFYYNIDLLLNIFKRLYHIFEKNFLHFFEGKKTYDWGKNIVKGWLKHVKILKNFTNQQLSEALLMACLRYIVYSVQYYCIIQFMGIQMDMTLSAACISTIFLLQTCVPLPPVTGLFARGGTAVYIWGFSSNANEIAVLASTFGLWLINIITPALIGLIFILRKNYFSKS
jgi:type IV secretory pathway VirB2 component (pilin)